MDSSGRDAWSDKLKSVECPYFVGDVLDDLAKIPVPGQYPSAETEEQRQRRLDLYREIYYGKTSLLYIQLERWVQKFETVLGSLPHSTTPQVETHKNIVFIAVHFSWLRLGNKATEAADFLYASRFYLTKFLDSQRLNATKRPAEYRRPYVDSGMDPASKRQRTNTGSCSQPWQGFQRPRRPQEQRPTQWSITKPSERQYTSSSRFDGRPPRLTPEIANDAGVSKFGTDFQHHLVPSASTTSRPALSKDDSHAARSHECNAPTQASEPDGHHNNTVRPDSRETRRAEPLTVTPPCKPATMTDCPLHDAAMDDDSCRGPSSGDVDMGGDTSGLPVPIPIRNLKEEDSQQDTNELGGPPPGNLTPPNPNGKQPKPVEVIMEPVKERKPLARYPPMWAQTRQEVCETFEWFRSYQGGVYFVHDIARGYLLSAFGAKRDVFAHKGRLIISHGGGRAESLHSENGKLALREAGDQQADDKSVRALLKSYREGRPIALVIDDRYPLFPFSLGSKDVTYAILGFYMIAHAWAEYQGANTEQRIIRYKFAFQWCEGQGEPWWSSVDGIPVSFEGAEDLEASVPEKAETIDLDNMSETDSISLTCPECRKQSPHVYKQAQGVCLNPSCSAFWRVQLKEGSGGGGLGEFMPDELEYQEDFLRLRKPCYLPLGYESLRPPLVTERQDGVTTSAAFTRGFHCLLCGRLSCRAEWQYWKCSTFGCDNSHRVPSKVHKANEFCYQPISAKFDSDWIEPNSGIVRKQLRNFTLRSHAGGLGQIQTIALPRGRGYLHHIRSNTPFSKDEANKIFEVYQMEANEGQLKFRRWPMRAHKCRGALLTNYFSHNAGVPYHYVGGTENTVPFDEAPMGVVNARALVQKRISEALSKKVEFNEVLTAAYMENQKMAFHSDDEKGLGPLVAGLSLGSPAFMHFRLQRRYSKDQDSRGVLLSFVLRHGDVLVMEGSGVQEYYEHTVVPTNFRIAATARFIHPGLEHTQVQLEEPPKSLKSH